METAGQNIYLQNIWLKIYAIWAVQFSSSFAQLIFREDIRGGAQENKFDSNRCPWLGLDTYAVVFTESESENQKILKGFTETFEFKPFISEEFMSYHVLAILA